MTSASACWYDLILDAIASELCVILLGLFACSYYSKVYFFFRLLFFCLFVFIVSVGSIDWISPHIIIYLK